MLSNKPWNLFWCYNITSVCDAVLVSQKNYTLPFSCAPNVTILIRDFNALKLIRLCLSLNLNYSSNFCKCWQLQKKLYQFFYPVHFKTQFFAWLSINKWQFLFRLEQNVLCLSSRSTQFFIQCVRWAKFVLGSFLACAMCMRTRNTKH